jgi:hypothetical protein
VQQGQRDLAASPASRQRRPIGHDPAGSGGWRAPPARAAAAARSSAISATPARDRRSPRRMVAVDRSVSPLMSIRCRSASLSALRTHAIWRARSRPGYPQRQDRRRPTGSRIAAPRRDRGGSGRSQVEQGASASTSAMNGRGARPQGRAAGYIGHQPSQSGLSGRPPGVQLGGRPRQRVGCRSRPGRRPSSSGCSLSAARRAPASACWVRGHTATTWRNEPSGQFAGSRPCLAPADRSRGRSACTGGRRSSTAPARPQR